MYLIQGARTSYAWEKSLGPASWWEEGPWLTDLKRCLWISHGNQVARALHILEKSTAELPTDLVGHVHVCLLIMTGLRELRNQENQSEIVAYPFSSPKCLSLPHDGYPTMLLAGQLYDHWAFGRRLAKSEGVIMLSGVAY